MSTYQEAVADTMAAMEESRTLAQKLWEQRQAGKDDPELATQLQQASDKWDQSSFRAVQLAPDLESTKFARRLAYEGGSAAKAIPNHLTR